MATMAALLEDESVAALRFPASRFATVSTSVVCAVLCYVGVALILRGNWGGLFLLGLFGPAGVLYVLQALPNATFLELTRAELIVRSGFLTRRYCWDEIQQVSVYSTGARDYIRLTLTPAARRSRGLYPSTEPDVTLRETFGRPPAELRELLEACRLKVVAAGKEPKLAPAALASAERFESDDD